MPTVIVYWSPGRGDDQKQRVARRIAQALVEDGGARAEDVLIIFQHIEAGNSARGADLLNPPLTVKEDDETGGNNGA